MGDQASGRPLPKALLFKRAKRVQSRYLFSPEHRLVYCPVEKNGCTFFKRLLLEHSPHAEAFAASGKDPHAFLKQTSALQISSLAPLRDRGNLLFAVVRDPVERVVSAYLNKFVRNRTAKMAREATESFLKSRKLDRAPDQLLTFEEFVSFVCESDNAALDVHWRPQRALIALPPDVFDWLVPMENIPEFVRVLEERIGVDLTSAPTDNRTAYDQEGPEGEFWAWLPHELRERDIYPRKQRLASPELTELICERYSDDVDLYSQAVTSFAQKLRS